MLIGGHTRLLCCNALGYDWWKVEAAANVSKWTIYHMSSQLFLVSRRLCIYVRIRQNKFKRTFQPNLLLPNLADRP